MDRWLIALEVEFFKIDPTTAVGFVEANWPAITKLLIEARAAKTDDQHVLLTVHFELPQTLPVIGGSLTAKGIRVLTYVLRGDPDARPVRLGVFNLSVRASALDEALANPAQPRPPDPPGLAGETLRAARKARGEP